MMVDAFVWTRSSTGDIEYLEELCPTITAYGSNAVFYYIEDNVDERCLVCRSRWRKVTSEYN